MCICVFILHSNKILCNIDISVTVYFKKMSQIDNKIDTNALSKLKWRARRGMLENDIVLTKFFNKYEKTLTTNQAYSLEQLLDLSDNDLLDLILKRTKTKPEWQTNTDILDILQKLQEVY